MSVNFELLAQPHAKLCLCKVQKLDASMRPPNPITLCLCINYDLFEGRILDGAVDNIL